ncbi:MAG: S1 RNA-binding domain-containing protein, partial [bacterium]
HISDLSWSQRQRKPSAFAKKGDEIEVKILHIDADKERLSLGIKQLTEDPWKNLEDKININDEVIGRIVNVTDFGIFVEVMEGVEGLVHISEIDQDIPKEKIQEFYQVNSLIRAKVLKIDVEERRLGLGIIGHVENADEIPGQNEVLRQAMAGVDLAVGTDPAPTAEADEKDVPPAGADKAKAKDATEAEAEDAEPPTSEAATEGEAEAPANKAAAVTEGDAPTEAPAPETEAEGTGGGGEADAEEDGGKKAAKAKSAKDTPDEAGEAEAGTAQKEDKSEATDE